MTLSSGTLTEESWSREVGETNGGRESIARIVAFDWREVDGGKSRFC